VGSAALTVDPFSVDALREGIDQLVYNDELRTNLIAAGPIQARRYSWDNVATKVSVILEQLRNSIKK
jgi:glycosyltransferase involved in cell wall biosynthesis